MMQFSVVIAATPADVELTLLYSKTNDSSIAREGTGVESVESFVTTMLEERIRVQGQRQMVSLHEMVEAKACWSAVQKASVLNGLKSFLLSFRSDIPIGTLAWCINQDIMYTRDTVNNANNAVFETIREFRVQLERFAKSTNNVIAHALLFAYYYSEEQSKGFNASKNYKRTDIYAGLPARAGFSPMQRYLGDRQMDCDAVCCCCGPDYCAAQEWYDLYNQQIESSPLGDFEFTKKSKGSRKL